MCLFGREMVRVGFFGDWCSVSCPAFLMCEVEAFFHSLQRLMIVFARCSICAFCVEHLDVFFCHDGCFLCCDLAAFWIGKK